MKKLVPSPSQCILNKKISEVKTVGNFSFNYKDLIGLGTFGKVYKGIDKVKKELIAIKVVDIQKISEKDAEAL